MLSDSSKGRAKVQEQRAKFAGGSANAPVAIDAVPAHDVAGKNASELNPKISALSPPKVPWGPWVGLVYAVAVFIAMQFMAGILLYFVGGLRGLSSKAIVDWLATTPVQFMFTLLAYGSTFVAILWFVRRQNATLGQIGLTKFRWMHVVWALCGFAVYFVAYIVLYAFVAKYVPSINVNQEQDLGFKNVTGALPLALTFISLVVLPPIVEETVFRGFIFSGLRSKYRFIFAALVTSALFAVAHLQFGSGKPLLWIAAIDTFTLSMVLCYIRDKTGSIVPTIFIHGIKNCLAFLVLYVFKP